VLAVEINYPCDIHKQIWQTTIMQTIEVTIDEALLARIDRVIRNLSLTRAAFIQQSLEAALQQEEVLAQEQRHAEGYARNPVEPGEFDDWENVRLWEQS